MSNGVVIRVDQTDQRTGYGALCIIRNLENNDLWLYGDLSDNSVIVNVGDTITQGQQISWEGNPAGTASTGLHVHIEKENQLDGVFKFGYANSIDPTEGTGINNVVSYTTQYIYNGTPPTPPTPQRKKHKFKWAIYANKLRNKRSF